MDSLTEREEWYHTAEDAARAALHNIRLEESKNRAKQIEQFQLWITKRKGEISSDMWMRDRKIQDYENSVKIFSFPQFHYRLQVSKSEIWRIHETDLLYLFDKNYPILFLRHDDGRWKCFLYDDEKIKFKTIVGENDDAVISHGLKNLEIKY